MKTHLRKTESTHEWTLGVKLGYSFCGRLVDTNSFVTPVDEASCAACRKNAKMAAYKLAVEADL